LLRPPYKVLVLASHGVGKTFLAGGLVNWWYDTRPQDSAVLTTAPTDREVKDLTWRKVRLQRKGRGGFRGKQRRNSQTGEPLCEGDQSWEGGVHPGETSHPHLILSLRRSFFFAREKVGEVPLRNATGKRILL
jgi:hypothetical protein